MIPDFNKLIHSVTYYLSYQDRIGRDFMIDESSLKYPVADYLTSLKMPIANIHLEYPHPDLKKRQIDLVITNNSKTKIVNAFEFKISRFNTQYESEQKRIFNDLMRLYLISKSKGTSCYFVMAGKQEDFIPFFRSIDSVKPTGDIKKSKQVLPLSKGHYTEWFDFKVNKVKTFDVGDAPDGDYKKIYSAFLVDYKLKEEELPKKLTTTCIAISALSREYTTPYVGGIWKIEY